MKFSVTFVAESTEEVKKLKELIAASKAGEEPAPAKRGKKAKPEKEEDEDEEESEDDDAEEESEDEDDAEDEDEEDSDDEDEEDSEAGPTKEDVIKALNKYAKANTRAEAKTLLKKVGGADSIAKIKKEKYPLLLKKLKV